MKHVGFFVVGEGKFGEYAYGDQFIKANESVSWDELIDFPVFSIVFFPNGKRRTTIL